MISREFTPSQWTTLTPAADWQFGAGLFTGGTRSDLLGYHPGNGTLWVGANTGSGLSFAHWATVTPASGWQFVVGDVTGGGGADLVGYNPRNGSLWVGENLGTSFQFQQRGTVSPAAGWQFGTGFFTGGAKADLFGYFGGNGTLWVGRNTGAGFTFELWGTMPSAGQRQFVVGDLTGTGRADVVGYDPTTGELTVAENNGNGFLFQQWGTLSPAAGWTIGAGFFGNRGRVDVFAYFRQNGSMWVGENTGSSLVFQQWAIADPPTGWLFVTGAFDDDIWVDLIGFHPSNGSLWLWKSTLRPIEGYCWPLSAAPGEAISFKTSGGDQSTVTFNRHSSTSPAVDSVAMQSVGVMSPTQPVPLDAFRVGCGWTETISLAIPANWTSGIYSAECVDAAGGTSAITFVVKPAPQARSKVALLANVNTWLAYNGWGGQSKYSGLAHASFLRPIPAAAPTADPHLTRGELWIHGWLEREGYAPDVYTDIDFHNDGCDPAQYACLVVGTHPEYWSTQMYDNLQEYLDAGGSLAYLGGNGLFEAGVYSADKTEMVFLDDVDGGERASSLFRVLTPARAERSILGVATERCSVPGSPYEVVTADHALFDGMGLSDGAIFGDIGLNTGFGNGKASAWEVDTADGVGAREMPWDCGHVGVAAVTNSPLPAGLTILARGRHDGIGIGADMTYYDHPGGGFVFSVGSLTFGGSLVIDPIMSQLMRNVMTRAGVT